MKKFTVLVILALLAAAGTSYAADRVMAPTMEPMVAYKAPVIDREAILKIGIDSTIDSNVTALASTASSMFSKEIAGKGGVIGVIVMNGVPKQMFLRPVTPCRLVDTKTDGGPFANGEVRKYLLPGGTRCGMTIPANTNPDGVAVLLNVKIEVNNYPWEQSWGYSGLSFDFVGTSYSSDWFTMSGQRGFLFASGPGEFPESAVGEVQGYVALKKVGNVFNFPLWGLEAKVSSQWEKVPSLTHVTVDIVGYAVPNFYQ